MIKSRLRFMLFLLGSALLLSSCASKDEPAVDEQPVLEAPVLEAAVLETPAVTEPEVPAQPAAGENVLPAAVVVSDEEPLPAADVVSDEEPLPAEENEAVEDAGLVTEDTPASEEESDAETVAAEEESEFIPVEEKPSYIVDVASYYDDFKLSEDDFIVLEIPSSEPEPEPEAETEPADDVIAVLFEEPAVAVVTEEDADVADEDSVSLEETAPVTDPIYIPSPREDMKKPVSVISEEQAAQAAELENEEDDSELEELLAAIPEPEKPAEPVASRSVTIRKNDIIEVPYQGNWWVYLGDATGSGALTFTGRDYIAEKTVFTLRAVKEGRALLHFFKQDIIAGVMVDDYLEVIVGETEGVSGKTTLDMYIISQIKNEPVESDEESGEEEPVETQKVTQPAVTEDFASLTVTEPPVTDTVTYVQVTEEPVVAVDYEAASAEEVQTPEIPLTDSELFARAQELEATDIEGAVELYKKLIAEYPASPYWTKANNRITYINRFYFFKR